MINWPWTKIRNNILAQQAIHRIAQNTYELYPDGGTILHYHNLQHVGSMYQHLQDTNEPYDEVLDWAVLFHDIVYDNKPDKELRSGFLFMDMARQYESCRLSFDQRCDVVKLILQTEKHENLDSPLVRADLHQLADSVQLFHNFYAIMQESKALYGCSERTFAANSEIFMSSLADRINMNLYEDTKHKRLWDSIYHGVLSTIDLARILQRT
jgi:predicted metal-dependent HD superfamily phosphohydrolase